MGRGLERLGYFGSSTRLARTKPALPLDARTLIHWPETPILALASLAGSRTVSFVPAVSVA